MLPTKLTQHILEHGPLSVASFMEKALLDPDYGYYYHRDPLGKQGDFTTAPEISPLFGDMLGIWVAHTWSQLPNTPLSLVELGPGRGTLSRDILHATRNMKPLQENLSLHLVEASPALKTKQQTLLTDYHCPITWHGSITTLPDGPLCIIANEFFDALPIEQYILQNQQWYKRGVTLTDDQAELVFILLPLEREEQQALQTRYPHAKENDILETCPQGLELLQALSNHLATHGGVMLFIDYGYYAPHPRTEFGDTLQALKNHQYHPVLEDVGQADITAHVDFAALEACAQNHNLKTYVTHQGTFLTQMGITLRAQQVMERQTPDQQQQLALGMNRLISDEEMGTLFRVLAITSPSIDYVAGFDPTS